MVTIYEKPFKARESKNNIKADVIILGCSLPGIVTAHKLKKKFGDSMDIVVLDLAGSTANAMSKCNVVFQDGLDDAESDSGEDASEVEVKQKVFDNVAKHYLTKYMKEFNIPVPDVIIAPNRGASPLNKLFQHTNGSTVECPTDYHDFEFLNIIEKFELNQYQNLLDQSMADLFKTHVANTHEQRCKLLYYDRTTMEQHIQGTLLLPTPREIMRTIVRIVCGASPEDVSVLFYLHQCYRTSSSRNHLSGHNTRFREKLLGHCRKRLATKLQQSVADITMPVKPIKEIRSYSDELVILETKLGENNYVCNLLAMAVRPDQLHNIRVEDQLLSERELEIANAMIPGRVKKFLIQYEENFWNKEGLSGDIFSVHGPILWAMERPKITNAGSVERFAGLIGFLKVQKSDSTSQAAVLEQLVKLFGEEAAFPLSYRETDIPDVYVPRCGDYVSLRTMTMDDSPKYLEWGALDIFADGDIASAIEAGHTTYVKLLSCLRPQAESYEDACSTAWMTGHNTLFYWMARFNVLATVRLAAFSTAALIAWNLVRSYVRKV